ncbi:MAG: competence/damage-inducible protein A [Labrys sp. (in: a-proteobacteria)]|jgi:molybdenum cofactor synthesis domain-containing protein
MSSETSSTVTAAVLVIGDEILSGRTKEKNSGHIADTLIQIGIDLREIRVVPDVEAEIVNALNALRARYDYVFTTGGIGPTHDDITADAVAAALGVGIDHDPRAVAMLKERYAEEELNEARLRMARIPFGADLIENPISKAPGFRIANVIVMAGVPSIMQRMLDNVLPTLRTGRRMIVETIDAGPGVGEGMFGTELAAIAASHPSVSIGSYPSFDASGFRTSLVVRGKDAEAVALAREAVAAMIVRIRATLIA